MRATHTQNQWALHLQHQKCCKLLFTMSFIAVLRKNMGRNMTLQSCIWIRAVTSDDDIVLHPINNSCNKVTLSLTSLDCCLRINVCIHRTSKVCRIAEHFGLFLKVTSKCDGINIPWWQIGPINRILVVYYNLFWWCDFIIHIIGGQYISRLRRYSMHHTCR